MNPSVVSGSEDERTAEVHIEDRLQPPTGYPGPDHQCHPVQLFVGEMRAGSSEPGVVEAEMIERELLGVVNSDAISVRVARPSCPLRHMGVVVFGEIVLRQLRNAGLTSDIAGVDLGDPLAHELTCPD